MTEFLQNLELWQKIVLGILTFLLLFSMFIYFREVVIYRKTRKVKSVPLTLLKITEDNFLVIKAPKTAKLQKTYRIYMNDVRSRFNFDVDDDKIIYVKARDIFLNDFKLEFCVENGIIFAKGNIAIDDSFARPYAKTIAKEPVEVKEEAVPVVEEVVEPVEETPVVEEVKEEPVVEEVVEEEPVEEVVEETITPVVEDSESESDESEVIIENGKKILITYNYSFQARLIQSNEEVRDWFVRYMNEVDSYAELKYKQSWKKIRVYKGRKTLAVIKFRGKKLCVAYALDPKKYEETKYRGIDLSDKKSYQDTPMMLKTTSERRLGYQLFLLSEVCRENGIEQGDVVQKEIKIDDYMDRDALINIDLVRVKRKEVELGEGEGTIIVTAPVISTPVKEEAIDEDDVKEDLSNDPEENENDSDESEVIFENGKKVIITYNYSFDARLSQASDQVKDYYTRLINELDSYADLQYKKSWKKIRVYQGRKTLANIKFRGKNISIAYALDPKKYAETKYWGYDLSDKKSYQNTPMMLKATSDRKFGYQLYLLKELCKENGIEQGEVVQKKVKIPASMSKDKLIEKQLIKVNRREVELEPTK